MWNNQPGRYNFLSDGLAPGEQWVKEQPSGRWRSASECSSSSSSRSYSSVDDSPVDKVKVRHVIGRFVQKVIYKPKEASKHVSRNREYLSYATIPLGNHSQKHGYATFGEIIRVLNFRDAVWDKRRRNYVITLAELAIFSPVTADECKTYAMGLGGEAQENFYSLVEEIIHFSRQNDNFERMRILKMVAFLLQCLETGCSSFTDKFPAYPSRFTGSYTLWKRRLEQVQRWKQCLINSEKSWIGTKSSTRRDTPNGTRLPNHLDKLPQEVRYKIKRSLSNGDDVVELNQAYHQDLHMWSIAENEIWHQLCVYNFRKHIGVHRSGTSWQETYVKLSARYQKENNDCIENLHFCQQCNCIFWKTIGHPHVEDMVATSLEVKPREFLNFFCR